MDWSAFWSMFLACALVEVIKAAVSARPSREKLERDAVALDRRIAAMVYSDESATARAIADKRL